MSNQPLEDCLDSLRRRLCFLPEAEREAEVAEFRSHLQERLSAYESAGATSAEALSSTLQKWGEPQNLVRALFYRWIRRKLDHPLVIALFLLGAGQYLVYGLSAALYQWYRALDPNEYFGIVRLFPTFLGSLQPPPHQASFPYFPLLLSIHVFAAVSIALLVTRLRLKNQARGAVLFTALHFATLLWHQLPFFLQGAFSLPRPLTLQNLLLDTNGYLQSLLGMFLFVAYQIYYPLITLFFLRSRKRANSLPFQGKAT